MEMDIGTVIFGLKEFFAAVMGLWALFIIAVSLAAQWYHSRKVVEALVVDHRAFKEEYFERHQELIDDNDAAHDVIHERIHAVENDVIILRNEHEMMHGRALRSDRVEPVKPNHIPPTPETDKTIITDKPIGEEIA
jgi:hypothetical protein